MILVGQHRCTVLFVVNTRDIQWTFPGYTPDKKLRESTQPEGGFFASALTCVSVPSSRMQAPGWDGFSSRQAE